MGGTTKNAQELKESTMGVEVLGESSGKKPLASLGLKEPGKQECECCEVGCEGWSGRKKAPQELEQRCKNCQNLLLNRDGVRLLPSLLRARQWPSVKGSQRSGSQVMSSSEAGFPEHSAGWRMDLWGK